MANSEEGIEKRNFQRLLAIRYSPFAIRLDWRPLARAHARYAAPHRSAPGGGAHVMRWARRMRRQREQRAESKAADVRPPGDSAGHVGRQQLGRTLQQLQDEPDGREQEGRDRHETREEDEEDDGD